MRAVRTNTLIGGCLIGVLLLLMTASAFLAPFDLLAIDLDARLKPPSTLHWFGTDEFGRDVFRRAIVGARISALISIATVLSAVAVGTAIGALAGFARGWTDRTLMAANDALLAFPGVLLAIALMVIVGGSIYGLVTALCVAYAPVVIRVVRGAVLSIREKEYVEASRVMGNSELYSLLRHVLPNAFTPVAVLTTSMFGWVLLAESALSFLGLGVPPPAPTWGNMLAAARPYFEQAPWLALAPGSFIALTLLGINLLGDSLRDTLDPRKYL
jgi:peptide/nickel transport system permease protein